MNHYDVLEVSPKASPEVIKAAYKSLMQRFHPDKHPDNAALAQRAVLISAAYNTLSDADKRADYDSGLHRVESAAQVTASARRARAATAPPRAAQGARTAWFFWGIVALIVICGGVSVSLLKANAARKLQPVAQQAPPELTAMPAIPVMPVGSPPEVPPTLTQSTQVQPSTMVFALDLRIALTAASRDPAAAPMLIIPELVIQISPIDSAEFKRYLDTQQALIELQLRQRLALLKPEELLLASGQQYLRRAIFDALTDITGTRRFGSTAPANQEAPSAYGITGVSLPGGFLLK